MNNCLNTAVMLSLVLHLAVLALGRQPPLLPEPPALQLVLQPASRQPQPVTPARPTPAMRPAAATPSRERLLLPPAPAQHQQPVHAPSENSVPLVTSKAAEAVPQPAIRPTETAPTSLVATASDDKKAAHAAEAASGSATGTVAANAVPEADPGSVVRYRLALKEAMRGRKNYPALARERGWEGEVELRLNFRRDLPGGRAQISRSSRYSLLDHQALAMVQAAMADAPLPTALRGTDFSLSLMVEFSLEDD